MINGSSIDKAATGIASMLSENVLSSEVGLDVLSKGLDKFVRETEGGKVIVNRITIYTLIPYLVAGFMLGWLAHGVIKK